MTWFTASVLISIKPEGYENGPIQVYENMFLVEGATAHDAFRKAESFGHQEASLTGDGLTIDGKPAVRAFIGIRKLISVSNPALADLDQDRPMDGTEVTYAVYQVADEGALVRLAQGEEVEVLYLE
jgi:hypothetical protein